MENKMKPQDVLEILNETAQWLEDKEYFGSRLDAVKQAAADECRIANGELVEVVHGKWVKNKYGITECSHCHWNALETMTGCLANRHLEPNLTEYCPHCGAKMDEQ